MSDEYDNTIKDINNKFVEYEKKLSDTTSIPEIKSIVHKVIEDIKTLEKISTDHMFRLDAIQNDLSNIKAHIGYEQET